MVSTTLANLKHLKKSTLQSHLALSGVPRAHIVSNQKVQRINTTRDFKSFRKPCPHRFKPQSAKDKHFSRDFKSFKKNEHCGPQKNPYSELF